MRKIGKIEIKNDKVIKAIQFEGYREIISKEKAVEMINQHDIEEVFLLDNTKSLFGLDPNYEMIEYFALNLNLPITYGGGISNESQAFKALELGASRVYVNSSLSSSSGFLESIVRSCGRQALVGGIEYLDIQDKTCFINAGREKLDMTITDRAERFKNIVSEYILISMTRDGLKTGPDYEILDLLEDINIPLILSGGARLSDYDNQAANQAKITGLASTTAFLPQK